MNPIYHHKQIGYLLIGALSAGVILIGILMFKTKFNPITVLVLIVLAICFYLFHSLTIEINDQNLIFFFAHGFLKKKIAIAAIEKIAIVTNRWYYGWGVRLMPNGWLYNVSGLKAVEIEMKNGKTFRIGSDEPEHVKQVLEKLKHA